MNRKTFYQTTVFVLITIFILFFRGKQAEVAIYSDLNKMIDVVENHDGILTEWQLFAREPLENTTKNEMAAMIKKWQKQYPHFTWEEKIENNHWNLLGTFNHPNGAYEERLQISILTDETLHGFILYELTGNNWSEEARQLTEEKLDQTIPNVFHKTPLTFACIKGVFGDMMDIALYEKFTDLKRDFHGKTIEKLEEKNFVSVTIDSPILSTQIKNQEHTFNAQIAIRNDQKMGQAEFVIGTPVITIEY